MRLRKNRLVFLAMLGGAAYLVNKELQKNPELAEDARKQWSQVKDDLGRKVREARDQADILISDIEQNAGDIADDAWETVENVGADLKDGAKDLADQAKTTAADLKDDIVRELD